MGIHELQEFIETHCQQACRHVDLVQVARGFSLQSRNTKKRGGPPQLLSLVVDAESCLHKLYGGFYSDWACGGQWNRMMAFLNNLVQTCRSSNLELIVFFNGALEGQRIGEWYQQQADIYMNVHGVVRHVQHKATPPPKAWWVPPPMLSSCLRLALRQLGISVACSMDDHHQEVIAYCREYSLHGLLAQDADYAVFDPPRYFSAHHLKLTFRGSLETQEYLIDDLAKAIDLDPKRFSVMAALLGTHLLPEADLREFFCRICHLSTPAQVAQYPSSEIIRAVIDYVRGVPSVDDLDAIGITVFKNCLGNMNDKVNRFKQSVQYYVNGTNDGFFKYRPKIQVSAPVQQPGSYPCKVTPNTLVAGSYPSKGTPNAVGDGSDPSKGTPNTAVEGGSHLSKVTPNAVAEDNYLSGYVNQSLTNEFMTPVGVTTCLAGDGAVPSAAAETSSPILNGGNVEQKMRSLSVTPALNDADGDAAAAVAATPVVLVTGTSTASAVSQKLIQSLPGVLRVVDKASSSVEIPTHPTKSSPQQLENFDANHRVSAIAKTVCRSVSPEVMNIASERHQKGLMYPWIYQILTQREIKLPVSVEDEASPDLPLTIDLYRLLRQRIYGVLSDLSSELTRWKLQANVDKKSRPHVTIKEWFIPRGGQKAGGRPCCEIVAAETLEWSVPDLRRLWLGTSVEDKSYRLKTFLSCMRCDMPQNILLNASYVPQQFMILCCVLRYVITYKKVRVLRPYELDAFLCTAVSPLLQDPDGVQEIQLPEVRVRALHLASLFMRGVEHATFANDAVGAPVPWGVTCPWLFFDGKLFHLKLLKASNNLPLIDLCDGYEEHAVQVEKMKVAILHGISMEQAFALPSMMPPPRSLFPGYPPHPHPQTHPPYLMDMRVAAGDMSTNYQDQGGNRARNNFGMSPVDTRGGQLQIAGVVVGSWGANEKIQQNRNLQQQSSPSIKFVGPYGGHGRGCANRSGKSRNSQKSDSVGKTQSITKMSYTEAMIAQQGRGRGCTVELPTEGGIAATLPLPVIQLMKNTRHVAATDGNGMTKNGNGATEPDNVSANTDDASVNVGDEKNDYLKSTENFRRRDEKATIAIDDDDPATGKSADKDDVAERVDEHPANDDEQLVAVIDSSVQPNLQDDNDATVDAV